MIDAHADEDCCHNVKLLEREGGVHLPVPYDFDMAGIVDARYADPPAALAREHRLRSVRERLYRGFCAEREQLDAVLSMFTGKRDQI